MTLETVIGLITLLLLLIFLGIVVWAYSGKRKKGFDEAARLPLEDDKPVERRSTGEKGNE